MSKDRDNVVVRFGVSMDAALLKQFDQLSRRRGYTTRSEAIRDLIRAELVRVDWQAGRGSQMGVLTLVYDHHQADVQHKLTHIQHDHPELIITSLHIHLNERDCLEVVILKGQSVQLHQLAENLRSLKGVKHGELVAAGAAE